MGTPDGQISHRPIGIGSLVINTAVSTSFAENWTIYGADAAPSSIYWLS